MRDYQLVVNAGKTSLAPQFLYPDETASYLLKYFGYDFDKSLESDDMIETNLSPKVFLSLIFTFHVVLLANGRTS